MNVQPSYICERGCTTLQHGEREGAPKWTDREGEAGEEVWEEWVVGLEGDGGCMEEWMNIFYSNIDLWC